MAEEYGIGTYSAAEAARMIGMRPVTLRRWLMGYEHEGKVEPRLWAPQHHFEDDELMLGFRDLVEARVVHGLRGLGIGLTTIRKCVSRAREIVGDDRPFSTRQFKSDGRSIFLDITVAVEEPKLIDLRSRQWVFRDVVAPSLAGIDFGSKAAERWWLLDGKKTIVADPAIAFGQPIIAGVGMTTARVAQAVKAEGGVKQVARVYDLRPQAIRDALAYEDQLHHRKAA